jgi:hypothetical protein
MIHRWGSRSRQHLLLLIAVGLVYSVATESPAAARRMKAEESTPLLAFPTRQNCSDVVRPMQLHTGIGPWVYAAAQATETAQAAQSCSGGCSAAEIDSYLSCYGSPLAGRGATFVAAACTGMSIRD